MTTKTTRASNKIAIEHTCEIWSPGSDPRGLIEIAWRESKWSHKAEGDNVIALQAFDRQREKLEKVGNPWVGDRSLWGASRGLFQAMAVYNVARWDPVSHPWAFFHPVVATAAAARLWNRGIAAGCKNMNDLRILWGYGSLKFKPGDSEYDRRVADTKDRLRRLGYPENLAEKPLLEFGLVGFGDGPQIKSGSESEDFDDQYDFLSGISVNLGLPTVPPPDAEMPDEWTARVLQDKGDKPTDTDDDGKPGKPGGKKGGKDKDKKKGKKGGKKDNKDTGDPKDQDGGEDGEEGDHLPDDGQDEDVDIDVDGPEQKGAIPWWLIGLGVAGLAGVAYGLSRR